jgi:GDP-L-fucose synthase
LPASTLSSARLLAARYPHNSLEGQEGDVIEDSEPSELQGKIKDLVELICELMNFEEEIVWETDQPNGQPRRCLDTSKAKAAFEFTAQIDLRQGLKNTIDWYKNHAS